eukprot:54309-Pyramimonas_sp.AAC.1
MMRKRLRHDRTIRPVAGCWRGSSSNGRAPSVAQAGAGFHRRYRESPAEWSLRAVFAVRRAVIRRRS